MTATTVLDKLRSVCLQLPNATETVTFGNPTFQVRQKTFCVLEEYRGELSIAVKVGKEHQPSYLKDARFYRTPYVGQHGWVSLRVNAAPLDWDELQRLASGSYEAVLKPKKSGSRRR